MATLKPIPKPLLKKPLPMPVGSKLPPAATAGPPAIPKKLTISPDKKPAGPANNDASKVNAPGGKLPLPPPKKPLPLIAKKLPSPAAAATTAAATVASTSKEEEGKADSKAASAIAADIKDASAAAAGIKAEIMKKKTPLLMKKDAATAEGKTSAAEEGSSKRAEAAAKDGSKTAAAKDGSKTAEAAAKDGSKKEEAAAIGKPATAAAAAAKMAKGPPGKAAAQAEEAGKAAAKVEETGKAAAKEEETGKAAAKVEETGKAAAKVEETGKAAAKVEETGKAAAKVEETGKAAAKVEEKKESVDTGKKSKIEAPRRSLKDLLVKDAGVAKAAAAASEGPPGDEQVSHARQQLLQYYEKSQELLLQQQQYYVSREKEQELQQQEETMLKTPSPEQVTRLRRLADVTAADDAALATAITNIHKMEIARRRLRAYMLEHRSGTRQDLLEGKTSPEAVATELSKMYVKFITGKEWVVLVQQYRAQATALDVALEKMKKEAADAYDQMMSLDYRDAAKLRQQQPIEKLQQQLLADSTTSLTMTYLLELIIDEIEFFQALKEVHAYLEKEPDILRSLLDSRKYLSASSSRSSSSKFSSSSSSGAAATATRGRGSAPAAGRAAAGASGAAASRRFGMPAAADGTAAAGGRRAITAGRTTATAVSGGRGADSIAAAKASVTERRPRIQVKVAAKGLSVESLRVKGMNLLTTVLQKLQQQFSPKYRTAALAGAAHALEGLELPSQPCWLAELLLVEDAATGILLHHHVISYLLLFLPTVSYVRLQQCSSLTYRVIETDLNRRLYRLPLQVVPQKTDLSYFYHVVGFFFGSAVRLRPLDRLRYKLTQQTLAAASRLLPVCVTDFYSSIYVSLDALSHDMISSIDSEKPLPHLWRKNRGKAAGKTSSQEISLLQFIEEYKMRAEVQDDVLIWQQPLDGVDVHAVGVLLQHLLKTLTAIVEKRHGQCFFRRTEYILNNDLQVYHRIWLQCNIHWGGKLEAPGSMKRLHFTVADNFRWEA